MMVPFTDNAGRVTEILDSRDLTPEEWALVKASKSGALSTRDLPDGKRAA